MQVMLSVFTFLTECGCVQYEYHSMQETSIVNKTCLSTFRCHAISLFLVVTLILCMSNKTSLMFRAQTCFPKGFQSSHTFCCWLVLINLLFVVYCFVIVESRRVFIFGVCFKILIFSDYPVVSSLFFYFVLLICSSCTT